MLFQKHQEWIRLTIGHKFESFIERIDIKEKLQPTIKKDQNGYNEYLYYELEHNQGNLKIISQFITLILKTYAKNYVCLGCGYCYCDYAHCKELCQTHWHQLDMSELDNFKHFWDLHGNDEMQLKLEIIDKFIEIHDEGWKSKMNEEKTSLFDFENESQFKNMCQFMETSYDLWLLELIEAE